MNIPFYIAKRYLFSKKNRNAINIISGISVLIVAVSTAALIIVLSSINGFGKLIDEQISTYAPDLLIKSTKGKTFFINTPQFNEIKQNKLIKYFAEISEENILLKYNTRQLICIIKGVDKNYAHQFGIDTTINFGTFKTEGEIHNFAVIGSGIAYSLGISIDIGNTLSVWSPNRKTIQLTNPGQSFNTINLIPAGVVSLDSEFDSRYIFSSNNVVRKLSDRKDFEVSSIELLVKNKKDIALLKQKIKETLGNNFTVKDLHEQFDVYRVMKSERLAAFIIMLFIILVASFSIIGSVTMLIIEKKEDIFTLQSMGTNLSTIKKVFFIEGLLISFTGIILGLFLGALISIGQQYFGFVTFPTDGNYIVEAYPVDVKFQDFILTFISVMLVGSLISLYPAMKIKSYLNNVS